MAEVTTQRKIADTFAAGCRLFDAKVPGIRNRIAEEQARSLFEKACREKTEDSRFDVEAPQYALLKTAPT
jgi:hypothetical protein